MFSLIFNPSEAASWDIVGHLQGSKRPPWETPKKSEKGFPGPLGPGVKQGSNKSTMTIFQVIFRVFGSKSTRFRLFFEHIDPGAERPWQPLLRLLQRCPGRGFFDTCRWPTISQAAKFYCTKSHPGSLLSLSFPSASVEQQWIAESIRLEVVSVIIWWRTAWNKSLRVTSGW